MSSVSRSLYTICVFASPTTKPPSASETNAFAFRSNSRTCDASEPPLESLSSTRSTATPAPSSSTVDPAHTHVIPSAFPSASRSSTTSHAGASFRYSASVHRRQMPFTWTSSCQKL